MNLAAIDPAFGQLSNFAKVTGNAPRQVQALRESAIFRDGALSGKFKTLAALLWAVSGFTPGKPVARAPATRNWVRCWQSHRRWAPASPRCGR